MNNFTEEEKIMFEEIELHAGYLTETDDDIITLLKSRKYLTQLEHRALVNIHERVTG